MRPKSGLSKQLSEQMWISPCLPKDTRAIHLCQMQRIYSPGHVTGVDRTVIRGRPDSEKVSTSYVERFNLSSRMQMRRFTRLTNGFSKKLENHKAAVALWIAFYNLCRIHDTLRCTPAMALGVTDHIWTIAELVQSALKPSDMPPLPRPTPQTTLRPGYRPFKPIVIRGGRELNPKRSDGRSSAA
jgi:hypothetical protein